MSKIVGVKYVGGKSLKEDNVLKSGATWLPGQVINFNAEAAAKLALYNDVWHIVDVDHNAETKVVGEVKQDKRKHEPQTFADVNSMNKEQLQEFARVSLLRQLPDDMALDALRTEVKNLLTLNFLDDQDETARLTQEGIYAIALEVTETEYQAYLSGELVLRLVPKQSETISDATIENKPTENTPTNVEPVNTEPTSADPVNAPTQNEPPQEPESLEETLAKLQKPALRDMCKELGITYSNTMSEEAFRARILEKAQGGENG